MKILLDENLPHELRQHLPGHDVYTVQFLGWSGLRNGELLRQAAAARFEVMVTMDQGVMYQQNLATLPMAVIVLLADSNDIEDLRPLIPLLLQALGAASPRTVVRIG